MSIFTILIFVLFATAIVDLIVGVSNDAVNFLNSAIGSRVASFRTILIIATLGILLGSTFSSGMMEIARSGIFNPGYFSFREVMYIFLAVMLTDIILLDLFNDFGLPTSTTVSLVFELLGAALMAGILTSLRNGMDWASLDISNIINFSSAITIVSGIFLSIFLAFFVGTFIQHVSRIVFTFSLKHSLKKYGAVFSGLSITTIVYFLLIKGVKGSSFVSDEQVTWVMNNAWTINLASLVFWSILFQFLMWYTRINPLRIVVLLGTFALAMAFAGNDLVNFIGVAMGGWLAFQAWTASGVSADDFNMAVLAQDIATPTWMLLLAGGVMIITLWTNAKSRKVTETEVSLGRQEEGDEKFKSNWFSRLLVGSSIRVGRVIEGWMPKRISKMLASRFTHEEEDEKAKEKDRASFDLVRGSVNLLVSSSLIAFGTSQKLPLSTTFVTFMVAMGSSFADQAWGRESAVYRVSGVMNVIAGWFMTALIAFSASGVLALVLYHTGAPGVFVLVGLAAFLLIRSHIVFARKEKKEAATNQIFSDEPKSIVQAIDESKEVTIKNLKLALKVYAVSLDALAKEKKSDIVKAAERIQQLREQNEKFQGKIIKYVKKMPKNNLPASRLYLLMFDHLQDLYQSVQLITDSIIDHLANFHSQPSKEYLRNLDDVEKGVSAYINLVCDHLMSMLPGADDEASALFRRSVTLIDRCIDQEIGSIQKNETGNRISLLQVKLLLETKDMIQAVHDVYSLYHHYHSQKNQ